MWPYLKVVSDTQAITSHIFPLWIAMFDRVNFSFFLYMCSYVTCFFISAIIL